MSNNDINLELQVTKYTFDMIITLMLHDACHDFDNDKSSAAFKSLFLANKSIPSGPVARLSAISSALKPTGIPGVSGGGLGETFQETILYNQEKEEKDYIEEQESSDILSLHEALATYIKFLLEGKYSFNFDISSEEQYNQEINSAITTIEGLILGEDGYYDKNILEDFDFLLGLYDKLSPGMFLNEEFIILYQLYNRYKIYVNSLELF